MTPEAFTKAIAALNLTQARAAELLGVTHRTSNRWAMGRQPIPDSVEMALQMMIYAKIEPSEYLEWREAERRTEKAADAPS